MKSFDRNSTICNTCYHFIKKAHSLGLISLVIKRRSNT